MWTINSRLVSEQDKKKIMVHIASIRWIVKEEQEESNRDFLAGSRFNDDEQVFQAFCQANINERQSTIDNLDLPELCEKALISAGECDYYYAYEKEY